MKQGLLIKANRPLLTILRREQSWRMKATGSMGTLGISGVIWGVMQWLHGLLNSQTQRTIFLNIEMASQKSVFFFTIACCSTCPWFFMVRSRLLQQGFLVTLVSNVLHVTLNFLRNNSFFFCFVCVQWWCWNLKLEPYTNYPNTPLGLPWWGLWGIILNLF